MSTLAQVLAEQARAYSFLEVIAVAAAVLYLLLAIRQNIWCWFFAAISTTLYVLLFIDVRLYMEAVLNGFYLCMAIYGWYTWRHGRHGESALSVTSWAPAIHLQAIAIIVVVAVINGYLLDNWTNAAFPYVDSMTTWAAIWATFLVARKILENWWYWLVIDIVSVFIYWQRDLQLTALLFAVYVVMIPFGLISWTRSRREART